MVHVHIVIVIDRFNLFFTFRIPGRIKSSFVTLLNFHVWLKRLTRSYRLACIRLRSIAYLTMSDVPY